MTAVFVANGVVLTSWVVRIPDIRAGLGIGEAALGTALIGLSLGIVVALPLAGAAVPRVGSRAVTLLGAAIAVLALPAVALAGTTAAFAGTLAVLGLGTSTMNVGMNAQGVGIQLGYGRSILVGMHAAWSVGSLLASSTGTAAIAAGVAVTTHLGVTAGAAALTVALAAPWLRVRDRVGVAERGLDPPPRLALPTAVLLPMVLVAFGASMGENTVTSWSGVYLEDVVRAQGGQLGWGLVAYTAAQTLTRLVGDRIADRLGAARAISLGARLGAAGFALLVLVPVLPVALLGFALVAVGLAVMIPLAFVLAARVGRSPGEAIAAVGTVGHMGFIVAPPLVGTVAEWSELRVSFLVIGVAVLVMAGRRQALERTGSR